MLPKWEFGIINIKVQLIQIKKLDNILLELLFIEKINKMELEIYLKPILFLLILKGEQKI